MMIKVMSGVSQVADLDKIKTEILTNRINNDRMDIGPLVKIKETSLKNFSAPKAIGISITTPVLF